MNDLWEMFLGGDYGVATASPASLLLALMVAFLIGQMIGWVYMLTHTSLSYSQTFVASLVVIPVIVSLMMVLMSGSLMIAFGLLAVFAVVRFRNVLKDTRDTTYILWTIVEGMAAGTMRHTTAILGTMVISALMLYLWATRFGARHRFDAVLTLRIEGDIASHVASLKTILHRHARRIRLESERWFTDSQVLRSYRFLLRNPERSADLQQELDHADCFQDISLYSGTNESEI